MSLFKFIAWFAVGTIGTILLAGMLKSNLLIGFINGLILGVLGAKD